MNRSNVEEIKARLSIDEVIGSYVKMEKAGKSFKAKCPFHNEKTASFFVSPERGGYYCFGCGAKGDIFSFVEQFEGLDFKGALKILADRAGIKLVFDQKADSEHDKLYQALEEATKYFELQFEKSKEALEYIKNRGISDTIRKEFRIGWAPDGWRNLLTYLRGKGFGDSLLEKAGLIKRKESQIMYAEAAPRSREGSPDFSEPRLAAEKTKGEAPSGDRGAAGFGMMDNYYDRFRGRIMFPINDSSGRVIAFSGRILKDDGQSAKYLNSPDTPLYDKSMVLYGLDKAKSEIRRMEYSILVEGQMDLVMSHQSGIKNTVAASGTALTGEAVNEAGAVSNLGLIRRLSSNIILAFDSDAAGRKAAMRAAGIALGMGMDVKVADIQGGKDPADLVKDNPENWKNILRAAKSVVEFELTNVLREITDPRKYGRALRERVFPFLAKMESTMDKSYFVKMIAERVKIADDAVWRDLREFENKLKVLSNSVASSEKIVPRLVSPLGVFPSFHLASSVKKGKPSRRSGAADANSLETGATSEYPLTHIDLIKRRIFGLLELMKNAKLAAAGDYSVGFEKLVGAGFSEKMKSVQPILADLSFEAEAFYGIDQNNWEKHMKELLINFEEDTIADELVKTMNELKSAEKEGNHALVGELAKKCQVLSMRKVEVAKKRH